MSAPRKPTAREKLQGSSLRPTQLELMGDDVDLDDLYLALNHSGFNIVDAVTDANVERTIEGASTLTVDVVDRDKVLLKSGRLSSRNDTEVDGLFFRLKSVEKSGPDLTLTFEDREIAVLRTYDKPIKQALATSRQKLTRAQFVLRMIREVKELRIKTWIPELSKIQPIGKASLLPSQSDRTAARSYGISKNNDLTVKGQPMTEVQRRNANAVLDTGVTYLPPLKESVVRKCLVMSMMCVIQESDLANLQGGINPDAPTGLFQQRRTMGWPGTRDIPVDATEFFTRLKAEVQLHPNEQYYAAIEAVQRSGNATAYAQWRTEAERIVTAYGFIDGDSTTYNNQWQSQQTGGDYEFYRGRPPTSKRASWGKESSWDCIQRLAQEVNWRAFFVSGVFYYISEDELLKSQPVIKIDESSEGIISIDGTYDEGKKSASLTVECFMGRWVAPPGSVVEVFNMGPWDGRWLVNDVRRSLFSPQGEITLKKKLPRLPEPAGSNLVKQGGNSTWGGTPTPDPSDPSGAQRGAPTGDAATLAAKLIIAHDLGKWQDDNGRGLAQMRKVAAGGQLFGARGAVFMDPGPIRLVLWLINNGYKIGTFAWCEDHFDDGPNGHAGGRAVDISSINGTTINQNTEACRKLVLEVDNLINNATGSLAVRQLITGGFGNHRDLEISNLSIPGSDTYYGSKTMGDHCDHIHGGY